MREVVRWPWEFFAPRLCCLRQPYAAMSMFWPWKRKSKASDVQAAEETEQESVNILRMLKQDCIALDLDFSPSDIPEEETDSQRERRLIADKEALIQELCDVLDRSGEIVNPTKFYKDMVNRERKASTAIAPGIALPHVRTMQCRKFVMGFARSKEGLYFDSLDGQPTKAFFLMASPPYEDKLYLKVYRQFAQMLQNEWVLDALMDAEEPTDVLNILRGYIVN